MTERGKRTPTACPVCGSDEEFLSRHIEQEHEPGPELAEQVLNQARENA